MSLSTGLQRKILAILDGTASHQEINGLVLVCQALARASLTKKSMVPYLSTVQGLCQNDLAYDCIAELFARDEDGVFVELRAYFAGFPVPTICDEDVLFHLQRLVASKTHQSIVRLYAEADPTLAKVLRNIKGSIQLHKTFVGTERFGEPHIAPALCESLEHLETFDTEALEEKLYELLDGDEFVPEALGKLALFLREQHECSRVLPLMMVARVLRRVYERKNCLRLPKPTVELDDSHLDRETLLEQTLKVTKADATRRYVEKGKLSQQLLDMYFSVIEEGLRMRYLQGDGEEFSLYGSLAQRMPSLTREEYLRTHKNRLEYLSRLTFEALLKHPHQQQI